MSEHDTALRYRIEESEYNRGCRRTQHVPPPFTEPGALAGVAITFPVAAEIAHAAHQALRAFVAVMSGQASTGPAWHALEEDARDHNVKHVQGVATGNSGDGWGQGSQLRNRVYSLVVMGILALGEEAGGDRDPASARRVDLAARVLGWLNDGEAMRVPLLGPILQVLSEHVTGDDDGAVGTARRLSASTHELTLVAKHVVSLGFGGEGMPVAAAVGDLADEYALVSRVLEPHRVTEVDPMRGGAVTHERPHETIGRLLGELKLAREKEQHLGSRATAAEAKLDTLRLEWERDYEAMRTRAEKAEALIAQVGDAALQLPAAVRTAVAKLSHRTDVHQAVTFITRLGVLASEGLRRAEAADIAVEAHRTLVAELERAPITVGGNSVIASSPLLVERIKLLVKMLVGSSEALAQERANHENYRLKALAWEDLILWIYRHVPVPYRALVDSHGDDPQRWRKWPDQVRSMLSTIITEAARQKELADAEAAERHDLEEQLEARAEAGYGDTATVDADLLLATLRSAAVRLKDVDVGMVRAIDAVVAMAEGERVVEQDDDDDDEAEDEGEEA